MNIKLTSTSIRLAHAARMCIVGFEARRVRKRFSWPQEPLQRLHPLQSNIDYAITMFWHLQQLHSLRGLCSHVQPGCRSSTSIQT
jgi:hypothetical protein